MYSYYSGVNSLSTTVLWGSRSWYQAVLVQKDSSTGYWHNLLPISERVWKSLSIVYLAVRLEINLFGLKDVAFQTFLYKAARLNFQ